MEKALPAKRRRAAKGTVLFTVVAVMMVLIVFLMGTLALAATANNRAQSNYQKVQTESTARTVLEAVNDAIKDDVDATGVRAQIIAEQPIDVQLSDSGQIYTVNVRDSGKKRSYFEPNERKWIASNIYELSVTVDKTKADTTYTAYVTAQVVTTPGSPPGTGGGGAFVSMGDTSKVGTGGFITGGTYVGIDNPAPSYTIADNDVYVDAPYYVNASVTTGGGKGLILHITSPGELFYINGDMTVTQTNQFKTDYTGFKYDAFTDYNKIPYILVEGTFTNAKDGTTYIGQYGTGATQKVPTNFYCGEFKANQSGLVLYGDLYCMNPAGENELGKNTDNGEGYLYKWVSGNVKPTTNLPKSSSLYGNIFSKGNFNFKTNGKSVIQGDFRCEKNINCTGQNDLTITGDLMCGDTLTIDGPSVKVTGAVYAGKINVKSGSLTCANYTTYEATGTVNGAANILSGGGTAIGTKEVTRTVTLKNDGGFVDGFFFETPFNGNASQVKITFECTESTTTVTKITGQADATTTEGPNTVREEAYIWSLPWDWSGTAMDYALTSGEYNNLKTKYQAQIDAAAAGGSATTSETLYQFDIASQIPASKAPIYPAAYTQANIKTTLNQKTPAKADYSSYMKDSSTVTDKGELFNGLDKFKVKGSAGALNKFYIESQTVGTEEKQYYVVKANCHFKNCYFDKNIYIDPESKITVYFENCTFKDSGGVSVIDNDTTYETTMYIIGTYKNNKGAIMTKYYWDQLVGKPLYEMYDGSGTGNTVEVHQQHNAATGAGHEDYPNFVIMSDAGAELDLSGNDSIVTAMIRAPQMQFKQDQGFGGGGIKYILANGNTTYYGSAAATASYDTDNHSIGTGTVLGEVKIDKSKIAHIGLIGQLIADDITLNNTKDWGMIFTEIPTGGGVILPPVPGSTNPFAGESTVLFYDYY